jgi:hypothetical protein
MVRGGFRHVIVLDGAEISARARHRPLLDLGRGQL